MKRKVNFRVIQGTPEDYWEHYEEFIRLYNSNQIPVKEISEKLELSQSKYRKYRKKALEENRLDIDNRKSLFKKRYGQYSRPKNYSKKGNTFAVSKYINGKNIQFGSYPTEEMAAEIVKKLIEENWDKTQLRRIQREVATHG